MSTDPDNVPVNSLSWWEDYFKNHWEANRGREQARQFMEVLAANLPETEREFLSAQKASVLDWGCAFGEGVDVLARTFPQCQVSGLDFAPRAIAEARRSYPHYEFLHTENGKIE